MSPKAAVLGIMKQLRSSFLSCFLGHCLQTMALPREGSLLLRPSAFSFHSI